MHALRETAQHDYSIRYGRGNFHGNGNKSKGPRPIGGWSKRMFDLAILILFAPVMLPLIALVAIAILLTDRGPLFYGHERVGFDGRIFRCWKFRSMVTNGDAVLAEFLAANPQYQEVWELERKLDCDPRVTRVGKIIRKLSLDELPQLFNVLTGEMSLVGPRPVVTAELNNYASSVPHYMRARPGVTGLWQVSGRSDISYKQRVQLDRYYVTHWNPEKDLWILLRTVPAVLASRGAK